jgi:hypothetical protein
MKKRLTLAARALGAVLMIAVLVVPLAAGPSAAQGPAEPQKPAQPVAPPAVITESVPQTDAVEEVVDEAPVVDTTDYPKLESQLEQLYESAVLGTGRPLETFAGQRHIDLASGMARVILEMDADPEAHQAGPAWIETIDLGSGRTTQVEHAPPIAIRADLLSAVEATGARYETAYQGLVQVLAPFGSLVALSEVPGVARVRLPYAATTQELPAPAGADRAAAPDGTIEVGYDDSEGVTLTNADDWILQGYAGSGVNLAVFDFGFTGYLGLAASGDLPSGANLVAKDYSASYAFGQEDPYGDFDHGAACAEIAHDMAPGARMYLYAFNTDVEFGTAMADYETNAGITGKKVATMSIGWVNAGPYDGTGPIDTIVNTAATTYNIFFATSAGNGQNSHDSFTAAQYSGNYVSFGGAQYNVFGPSGSCWNFPSGYTINVFLEWNDWQADRTGNLNRQDYDLYLYKCSSCVGGCTQVATSATRQCTSNTPDPTEAISYTPTTAGYYQLAIQRFDDVGAYCTHTFGEWLDLYSFVNTPGDLWWHKNYCNSITIPADADGAVAVGAVDWSLDGTGPTYGLEYFSSLGPRNASGGASNGTTRAKVDVVAPDQVSTATYGAGGFGGTSAASPHVAGLAATAWQANPTYTLAQLTSYVKAQAADRPLGSCGGSAGNCNTYGDGRINLPTPSTNTWTGATSADWSTASNWTSGAVPLSYCGTSVVIPTSPSGGRFPTLNAEAWVKDLTIQSGATLNGGSQTLHVCGNWANSGTFTGNTGTVNFMGTTTVSGGSTANNFNNLTISPGKALNLSNQSINVAGNWTDNGSTFTPGTSTVTFNKEGTQTVSTYAPGAYISLVSESFEVSVPPVGWAQVDTYATNGAWARVNGTTGNPNTHGVPPGGGTYVAQFNSWTYNGVATRLYKTAAVNLTGYYNSRARFYMYHDAQYTNGDFVQVEVSTDGGATFNDVGDPIYRYAATAAWTEHTVDLSTYDNASSVIVAFEGVSGYGNDCFIDLVNVEGKLLSLTDSTFYNLTIDGATGAGDLPSTTVASRNVTVTSNLKIGVLSAPTNLLGTLDVNAYKVLSVGGSYSYLGGWLSNYETRSVSTSPINFNDGRGTAMTNPTAQLTRGSGSSNYTVTTRAGYYFPANDFGTTCPEVTNAVWRYWNIVPASSASTTVRLYYLDTELNGNTESTLKIYHCTSGAWHEQLGSLTRDTSANWVQVTGVTDFSPFVLSSITPTGVEIKSFKAFPEAPAVHVRWETVQEIDNLGFNLYRSNTRAGLRTKLNAQLIPSLVPPGSPFGAVYDYLDAFRLRPGRRYFYWLEAVDLYGNTETYGPARAVAP